LIGKGRIKKIEFEIVVLQWLALLLLWIEDFEFEIAV
jgi:hypothetical protein